jgi:hypothetical protein
VPRRPSGMTPTVLRLNPEVVTSTAKAKMAPTTNRKILTPRLKAARLLQDASTVDRSPESCMHGLSSRTLCPALLLRFLASTTGKSRRSWKRCRPRATRRMESSVLSVPPCRRPGPGRLVGGRRQAPGT